MKHISTVRTILALALFASAAHADIRLCRYTRGNDKHKIVAVDLPSRCPANSEQILYQPDIYGGAGADLRIAAGASESLTEIYNEYRNCRIGAGATLLVRTGTVIRCNGSFENAGTLTIGSRAKGGSRLLSTTNSVVQITSHAPYPGIFSSIPEEGAYLNTSTETVEGGSFTYGGTPAPISRLLPGLLGGGGGAAGVSSGNQHYAGDGGGTVVIISKGRILNTGSILADGTESFMPGGGGGGGGIVVLASGVGIINSGTIAVRGGNGGAAAIDESHFTAVGGGGGGGGGSIVLVSPALSTGSVLYSGGTGGAAYEAGAGVLNTYRFGGGSGGPSYGAGGRGGSAGTSSLAAGSDGGEGDVDTIQKDPKLVF